MKMTRERAQKLADMLRVGRAMSIIRRIFARLWTRRAEVPVGQWRPLRYRFRGRATRWGRSLSHRQLRALRSGEVYILMGPDGLPHARVLCDSYGTLREYRIPGTAESRLTALENTVSRIMQEEHHHE
jgi:hypothetical protein